MSDAPLAAMIAAVKKAANHGGLYGNCLNTAKPNLRGAQRVLEALADRDEMAAIFYYNDSDTSDELWSELGESIREVYRLHVDGVIAALLARTVE